MIGDVVTVTPLTRLVTIEASPSALRQALGSRQIPSTTTHKQHDAASPKLARAGGLGHPNLADPRLHHGCAPDDLIRNTTGPHRGPV
jgi:hypothetical protein